MLTEHVFNPGLCKPQRNIMDRNLLAFHWPH